MPEQNDDRFNEVDSGRHDAQLDRIQGNEDTTDTAAVLAAGQRAVDAYGTSLGAAASGVKTDVDIEEARQRLRDVQTALVALGYHVGDHDDPAHAIDGVWGPGTRDAIAAFQDENGLDSTGQVDGETYQSILAAYADALATRADAQLQDDFAPLHAEQPLSTSDAELMDDAVAEPLDDSYSTMLELRDDL